MKAFLNFNLDDPHFMELFQIEYQGFIIRKNGHEKRIPIEVLVKFLREKEKEEWGE